MADHFTTRLQIPYPDIDDPADVPADMQQLAERLDLLIPGSGAGSVLNRVTVGDVGMAGQIRAGRQLTANDFTALGLSAPLGLWNLSDLSDVSGNNRALTNKGAVTFAPGVNGAVATAAQFTGSTAQALYNSANESAFRITTGSWGCWFRTAKRGTFQYGISKITNPSSGGFGWAICVDNGNIARAQITFNGVLPSAVPDAIGVTDIADDRWHFIVATFDGTVIRLYVDGILEGVMPTAGGMIFGSSGPLNIGGYGADASTANGSPSFGRVDEAFVTADVLTEDQARNLYCAKFPHGYGVIPTGIKLAVTRRRRGAAISLADINAIRIYNFTGGSLNDTGTQGATLTNNGTAFVVAGADGTLGNGFSFMGAQSLSATDAGLPQGTGSRSYGCWFKTTSMATGHSIAWGTHGTGDARIYVANGNIGVASATDALAGPYVADGQWHLAVVVEDNTAGDGVKRKLYLDGRLVGTSIVMNAIALGGVGKFRIGSSAQPGEYFIGQIDGVFVTDQALTSVQISALYAKSAQPLAPSSKNPGDHVEGWDAAAVYATFDTLEPQWQVDLGVAA